MRLYAIADLHLSYPANRNLWSELDLHLDDGLILCGDLGEKAEHLELAFSTATRCFKKVFWCPGNHELYSIPGPSEPQPRGEEKYNQCLSIARRYGVYTPEDDFFLWEGEGGPALIAPIFTLYDYSFRPDHLTTKEDALKWAEEADIVATDEFLLFPDPYPSREAWCNVLVEKTQKRLEEAASQGVPLIILNHWPLREDLVHIPRVPRFSLWCGTRKTEDWHKRFNAKVVVSGHLHVRRTDWKDGVRFEECSLGYPRQWDEVVNAGKDINTFLREILPGPAKPESGEAPTRWRRWG
ncbi:Metallo-dependent phosphatase [Cryphonectria parasitica EP155]|uniref:Metallo-dependent phosphatase n=1 Tax=Cryphonectria parasitica (strain ATCC 38755 / EP155) TaxID=660469 RepID=A0A9P4Y4V8_CRYP1|nr:Metallo-dependent phosphatase [Cryphonectria parasitica EP155]KAF3766571.1 Metallo-dependent phosphatase [Cryphonectria parasitica EP155]